MAKQPPDQPDPLNFKQRHAKDADGWKRVGSELADLTRRTANRELRHRGKAGVVPLVNVFVKTARNIVEELAKDPSDDAED